MLLGIAEQPSYLNAFPAVKLIKLSKFMLELNIRHKQGYSGLCGYNSPEHEAKGPGWAVFAGRQRNECANVEGHPTDPCSNPG